MKQEILDHIDQLKAAIIAIPEEDSAAQIAALKAQLLAAIRAVLGV